MNCGRSIEKKRNRRAPPERHFNAQPTFCKRERDDSERMIKQVNRDEREHHESREHTQSPLAERRVQSHGIQNLWQAQFGATCAARQNTIISWRRLAFDWRKVAMAARFSADNCELPISRPLRFVHCSSPLGLPSGAGLGDRDIYSPTTIGMRSIAIEWSDRGRWLPWHGQHSTTFLFCESALITKPLRNLVGCAFLPSRCEEKEKGR